MEFPQWLLTQVSNVSLFSADAVIKLNAEGATVPFIARYRKEQTGNLDEVQIRAVIDAKENWDELIKRQTFIIEEITKQNKMTDELRNKILDTFESDRLEDLYLPYKIKRKTKATLAKEAGLEPLAQWLWDMSHGLLPLGSSMVLHEEAKKYLKPDSKITHPEEALQGASDILVERLSENAELRQFVRAYTFENAYLRSKKGPKALTPSKFEPYFEYCEKVSQLLISQNSHRYLALRRGWTEEELVIAFGGPQKTGEKNAEYDDETFESVMLAAFENACACNKASPAATLLKKASRIALKAHVLPSIEAELHKALKKVADDAAIAVFANNVKKLLLAAPFGAKAVMGIDPGIRTGCKVVVVNESGNLVFDAVIFPNTAAGAEQAKVLLDVLCKEQKIQAVAIGNGTAGRETEAFVRETFKSLKIENIPVVMVNESGASVYSASDVAREEFPDKDVTVRGAVSIARRLQDPLAELVKIDAKSIGVGQYQHDVSQTQLKKSLEEVVDSCVNSVGVNLNTASYHLLARVSGIGPSLAKSVVQFRVQNGLFKNRFDLKKVTRFGEKNFEQSAGFLRISHSENPLDNTGVHPEKYPILEDFAKSQGKSVADLIGDGIRLVKESKELKEKIGQFSFDDIVKELEKPGRDPRDNFVIFEFRKDIHTLADLKPDMICPGIVTNVTNFGAFVDIGVHQDGLVHISQLSNTFVKDPKEIVSPGQHVMVKVLAADTSKKQISLTMKLEERSHHHFQRDPKREENRFSRNEKGPGERRPQSSPRSSGSSSGSGKPKERAGFANNPFAALASLSTKSGGDGPSQKKK